MNTKKVISRIKKTSSNTQPQKHPIAYNGKFRLSFCLKPLMPSEYTWEERKRIRDYEQQILKK